jgi:E3 Ubiquitin ligase
MPVNPQLVALGAGSGALLALYNFLKRLRRDRLLADTAPVRIRSAAQGYVKLSGRAAPAHAEPARAPLSGRPCVWWAFKIEHDEAEPGQRSRWCTMEQAASVELFMLIDDDAARCLVGPVRAEITPTTHNVWYGEGPRPMGGPPAVSSPVRLGDWRYSERLLDIDAHLSVVGELRSHSEVGDLNAITQEKLRLWKQDQASLLTRFDQDHDGRLSAAEWEAARQAAQTEAQAQVLASNVARVSVVAQPQNGEPFLIAPLSAAQLVHREKVFAALYFVLGLACVVVCAWALKGPR